MRVALVACLLLAACGPSATRVAVMDGTPHHHPFRDAVEPPEPTTTTELPTTTTTAERPPAPRTEVTAASRGTVRTGGLNWEALRQCESGGNYSTNTGNGYYGAYQANRGTWDGLWRRHDRADLVGTLPSDATPDDQDKFARLLYGERGAQPWPTCGTHL